MLKSPEEDEFEITAFPLPVTLVLDAFSPYKPNRPVINAAETTAIADIIAAIFFFTTLSP